MEHTKSGNHLLTALPRREYEILEPHLEEVELAPSQTLFEEGRSIKRSYFPNSGFISFVSSFEDEPVVETATIGPEGLAGTPFFVEQRPSPTRAVVQVPCTCISIPAAALRQVMAEAPTLRSLACSYIHAFVAQTLQNVACNATHTPQQRMAKWLLLCDDRMRGAHVPLTQETLAQILGVGRQTVSAIARGFADDKLISYRRGKIDIDNRKCLLETTCPCYGVIRKSYDGALRLPFA